jgi:hypothetical protein
MTAWKDVERRICRLLGGERSGPLGKDCSDCTGTGFSVEIKRTTRYSLKRIWLDQAQRHSKLEGKPWLLVVAEHSDLDPLVTCRLSTFLEIARDADAIPWTAPKEAA